MMASGTSLATFFLVSALIFCVRGQYSCKDFVERPQRNVTINDTFVGVVESVYISDIEDADIENSAYLEAYADYDNYLTINVKRHFKDYTEDYVVIPLILTCTDSEYTVEYRLKVEEIACERLTFDQPLYEYAFYDILPSGYEFEFSDTDDIVANCAGNTSEFSIEDNEFFTIKALDIGRPGQVHATLKVINEITAPFDEGFNVTVTDGDNPENVATAVVRIRIENVDFIAFTKSTYYGFVTDTLEVVIMNGPIVLDTADDLHDIEIAVSSDYIDIFDVQFSTVKVNLYVRPEEASKNLPPSPIVLTLTAYDSFTDTSAEAEVILDVHMPTVVESSTTLPQNIEIIPSSSAIPPLDDLDIPANVSTPKVVEETSSIKDNLTTNQKTEIDDNVGDYYGDSEDVNRKDANNDDIDDDLNFDDYDDIIGDDLLDDDSPRPPKEKVVRLYGFEFWVTQTKAFIATLVLLSVVFIVSFIVYIRKRMRRQRIYEY